MTLYIVCNVLVGALMFVYSVRMRIRSMPAILASTCEDNHGYSKLRLCSHTFSAYRCDIKMTSLHPSDTPNWPVAYLFLNNHKSGVENTYPVV